jgi:hypothetical protein
MQTPEQGILERIKVSRGTSEPSPEAPTENLEVVNVSDDAPVEDVVETEAYANEEVTTEIEEAAEEVTTAQANDEATELFYYEIDGEEVDSNQLKEWKANGLMQADYTRKTQELADSRKDFESKQSSLTAKESELNDKLLTLEAMLNEDTKTVEEIAEMREYEPEEYIKYTEKQSKLEEFVNSAKTATQQPSVDMKKVSADLFANHPEWMENGKNSQKFIDDTAMMTSYADSKGFHADELKGFEAKHYEIMLDAARYQSQKKSNAAIEKKVRKAPVSTRPRAAAKGIDTAVDKAQKAFNKNPNVQNAAALRSAKRQLN